MRGRRYLGDRGRRVLILNRSRRNVATSKTPSNLTGGKTSIALQTNVKRFVLAWLKREQRDALTSG
jgi:hypothetical protein